MSKVIIPIEVKLEKALQELNKLNKDFQQLATTAGKPLAPKIDDKPFVSIKRQLREANIELQNAVANFGKLSPQAQEAAKRVADLRDIVEDAGKAAAAADFEDQFQVAGKAIAGVASAFQTATALQAVFGSESKATEEALKKVQAVMALTQGITGLLEGKKAFEALAASGRKAFAALQASIGSFGIGALLVGLGAAVAYWDDIKTAIFGAKSAQEKLNEEVSKVQSESLKEFQAGFAEAKVKIDLVTVSIDQAKKGVISKESALQTYNETLGDSLGKVTNLDDAERTINANADTYIKVAGLKARANVFLAKSAEAAAKGTTAELEAAAETDALIKAFGTATTILGDVDEQAIKKGLDVKTKAYKADQKLIENTFQEQADALLREANLLEQGVNNTKRINDKKTKEEEDAEAKRKQLREKAAADFKKAQEESNKILLELSRRGATETEQAIFKIQDEYAQKRKTLAEAGIKDFTAINQAEQEDILKIQKKSVAEGLQARRDYNKFLEKLFNEALKKHVEKVKEEEESIKTTRELQQRAELSGIKDAGQRRLQELRNAENKEMDELEKLYQQKSIDLEVFLQRQSNIEKFYANERAGVQTDSQKKTEEELKAFQEKYTGLVESGLEDALQALGTAIGEGEDPFAALSKSIGNSLADFVTSLGKDMVKLGTLFEALSKALNKIKPPGLKVAVGLALIAFGAAIKSSINKKSQNKFATGGFVSGPGTETSDSIPARLSKGEYVIQAKSVRRYGARTMDKINSGQVPVASLLLASERAAGRNGDRTTALVNRSGEIQLFNRGGLAESFRQFGRNGESAKALVNRFEVPDFNSTAPVIGGESFQRGEPYIVTTKISGQDLKLVLERADRRFSNAT